MVMMIERKKKFERRESCAAMQGSEVISEKSGALGVWKINENASTLIQSTCTFQQLQVPQSMTLVAASKTASMHHDKHPPQSRNLAPKSVHITISWKNDASCRDERELRSTG